MRLPLLMTSGLATYVVRKRLVDRDERDPMDLMLEPLRACKPTCRGWEGIREYEPTIKQKLSLDECPAAVDESRAPVVPSCGGEPMIYPQIGELVAKIQERKRVVILCTNGMFTRKRLHEFRPSRT